MCAVEDDSNNYPIDYSGDILFKYVLYFRRSSFTMLFNLRKYFHSYKNTRTKHKKPEKARYFNGNNIVS